MSEQKAWPVVVEVVQTFVVGVKADSQEDARSVPVKRLQELIYGADPVAYEIDAHSPDRSEQTAYAEAIAYETDDSNF